MVELFARGKFLVIRKQDVLAMELAEAECADATFRGAMAVLVTKELAEPV
jgi:hypothetical protein